MNRSSASTEGSASPQRGGEDAAAGGGSDVPGNFLREEGTEMDLADISGAAGAPSGSAGGDERDGKDSFWCDEMSERRSSADDAVPVDADVEKAKSEDKNGESPRYNSPSSVGQAHAGGLRRRCGLKRGKYMWGGKFVRSMEESGGNFSLYSDEFSVEGLHHAFDSTNSWIRTGAWFAAFVAFGVFFLFLTVPMIKDYKERMAVTSIDTAQGEEGLPLPIITVCPHASGIKCDCLLWRKLHCRYRYHLQKLEWMSRFDDFACYTYFDPYTERINGTYHKWNDKESCQDFTFDETDLTGPPKKLVRDPCGVDPELMKRFPKTRNLTLDNLYDRIVDREASESGPYITAEEISLYGGVSLRNQVEFMDSWYNAVPREWVEHDHVDWGRNQICSQLRPPNDDPLAHQRVAGARYGLKVLVHGIREGHFPLRDMADSAPAVQVHINVNQGDQVGADDLVINPRNEYFDVGAGFHSTIEYETSVFKRYRGWGSEASQKCTETKEPRNVCVQRLKTERAGRDCGCESQHLFNHSHPDWISTDYFGCSVTLNTEQYGCVMEHLEYGKGISISYDLCSNECETKKPRIVKHTTKHLSNGQLLIIREKYGLSDAYLTSPQTILFDVGLSTMDIEIVTERPVTSFSELMGQIGGNLGLWCGLSFLTMVEVIEFSVIAMLYAKGFYDTRRRNLKEVGLQLAKRQ